MDLEDVLINCGGLNFVKDKSLAAQTISLQELIWICEELYDENERLQEEIRDLENDMEENCIRKDPADEYGVSQNDFI